MGRHIFFRYSRSRLKKECLQHELIHVCQYAENGFWGFLRQYLWRERRIPYREKSFEREAFIHQGDPEYRFRRWPEMNLDLSWDPEER